MAINNGYFVMPMNMDRVCRICLQENTNLSPIFCNGHEIGSNLTDISQKIQVCGAVECHEQDGLPALICDVCIYKASVAHEFRQLCQHSDARLRLYYNKPARFNATDSGTQTDLEVQELLTKSAEEIQNDYFVKQEVMTNQQFHNAISNEEYNPEPQTNTVVTTIESALPTVDVNMSVESDKLFNCHLAFEEQPKNIDKAPEVVACDTQTVECTQELIPVSTNLIDNVCTIEADMSTAEESDVKNDVSYFTYITKEEENIVENIEENIAKNIAENIAENIEQGENTVQKRTSARKTKAIPRTDLYEEMEDDNYFEPVSESQNSEEMTFKCESCSKRFTTPKGLKKHQLTHEKQYKCEVCAKTFCKLENLEKHKNIHTTKPHACQVCHASFSKSQSLVKHLKSHTEKVNDVAKQISTDEQTPAEIDPKKSPKSEESDDDSGTINEPDGFENAPEIFKCDECGQYCSTLKNLKRHALIHGERKYSCTVCKKWFFRPDTLKKHAERHGHGLLDNLADDNKLYDSDDDAFPSSRMNNGMTETDSNKKEESEEEGSGEYKCQHCDKIMATKKGLRRHVAMHKPKPEPAVCEICKKVCASRARLTLHQKTHNKPKEKVPREYLCHICSKVYPSNSSLTYHMRTHTGVKPHVCKTCNSGFTTTTSLANHMRIHTGDKPFVCHVCSAAFAVSSAFRRHLTRHTGEANYLCKTCGKAFKRLSTLKEHTYTHSGEKPYVCKTCGAAYSHSGSLFAHQKRCRAQFTEMVVEDHHHSVAHHIHVNNVQSAVRSLAVIGQMF
ncbi:hypothetical protein TSAR_003391 [Trichomalopsis sarcophagae]|uniref:Protein krueppel n=1 Tax=Trichomalopsis sarcophagae TaxID=543379 RepID=A0A232EVE1_9HYME|nr:hypothetical protein TSAR_003391 [Trichomalopsis sarcophagae]